MARVISGPKPGTIRKLIPRSFDNHLDKDPVTILIRIPTEGEKRQVGYQGSSLELVLDADGKSEKDEHGNPKIAASVGKALDRQSQLLEKFVAGVENYTGADGKILTGSDLIEFGETEIILEVFESIDSGLGLEKEELEKLEDSPASSQSSPPNCGGCAKTASETDCNCTETVEEVLPNV